MQIDHLDAVAERVMEVATETWDQLETVLFRHLIADGLELRLVAHDQAEVTDPIPLHALDFEERQELMLTDLEERIALALIVFLQGEHILIKRDRLIDEIGRA